jgi:hypothetical protein
MSNPTNVLPGEVVITELDVVPLRNLTLKNGTTLAFNVKS